MADDRVMIRAFMAGLVGRIGGVEPAAEAIAARLGGSVSKGSVSKRLSGDLDWPLIEILALEDALGDPCVRRWLARSLPGAGGSADMMAQMAVSARENGEAQAALLALIAGGGSRATARKEVHEAIVALTRIAAGLEDEQ